jgi:hypothetical protein
MLRLFKWDGYDLIVNSKNGYAVFLLGEGRAYIARINENYFFNCSGNCRFEFKPEFETLIVTGTIQVLDKIL